MNLLAGSEEIQEAKTPVSWNKENKET